MTLIVGFMFFASTHKGILFDRRLVLSGYPQTVLMLGKLLALGLVTALISLYTSLVLFLFWHPGHPISLLLIWLGFWAAALIYGSFGVLLGVLLTNELAGFFLVIMLSLVDTSLQNPLGNPIANQPVLKRSPRLARCSWTWQAALPRWHPGAISGCRWLGGRVLRCWGCSFSGGGHAPGACKHFHSFRLGGRPIPLACPREPNRARRA